MKTETKFLHLKIRTSLTLASFIERNFRSYVQAYALVQAHAPAPNALANALNEREMHNKARELKPLWNASYIVIKDW